MDIKIATRRKRSKNIPRAVGLNSMLYKTQWEYGGLSTGTSGTIARGDISPTIANSSEYSLLQSLFTQVRLLRCTVIFTGQAQSLSTVSQGRMFCSTNMIFTAATNTTPTSALQVQNQTRVFTITTNSVTPVRYLMPVPSDLEFSNITSDSPSTPTPWAGSPGCVCLWADNLTPSTAYFRVDVEAVYHLRGRQ